MRSHRRSLPQLSGAWRRVARELSAFGVVGGICFALDLLLFQLLYSHAGVPPVAAKAFATVCTSLVAFTGHRLVTYRRRPRTAMRRGLPLFALVNASTLLLGLGSIGFVRYGLGQTDALVLQATNVVSIVAGTALRFVCYRRWVFPDVPAGSGRPSTRRPAHPPSR